jgi:hypothetical protein
MSADAKRATRYFLFFPATVTSFRVYVDGLGGGTGTQVMRAILYADRGNLPTDELRRTFQTTIAAGRAPGWVTLYLPFNIALSPGYYWLGLHTGGSTNVARFSWSSRPDGRRSNIDGFADGPSSPFGPAGADEKALAINAQGF